MNRTERTGRIETVALIGLGAMGSFFAPRLYRVLGDHFRVIAGGERKKRLEEKGVTINGVNYHFPITEPESGEPAPDLILVAVKGYALDQAIEDIRGLVGKKTQILSVLNGVASERAMTEAFGEEHVLYSYMRVSIVMKDGCTDYDPALGKVYFGEKYNREGAYSERVRAVKELFDRCEVPYEIQEDMIRGLWFKFMCNVGENLTCALLGIPFGSFRRSEHANYIRENAMREVAAIAQRLGIELVEEEIRQQDGTVKRLPFPNKPSTLQDLEAGKTTEIEMFAGTVIRYGKELGIPTPMNELFYHGIRVLEEKNKGLCREEEEWEC